jgi:hypothetical protein
MKKLLSLLAFALIAGALIFGSLTIVYATNCGQVFPTSLNNYVAGCTIPSSWGNALEAKLGITQSNTTTSLDYQINHIFTSYGSEIVASSGGGTGTTTPLGTLAFQNSPLSTTLGGVGFNSTPSTTGQILIASGTGWTVGKLVAGNNVTINTSTPGQIAVSASAGVTYNSWIPWNQNVTSTASTTIGITDASNASSSQNTFRKGTVVKWLHGGITSVAMVTTSTYANGVTIAQIEGDQASSTITSTSSLAYSIQKANSFTLQYAGGIGTTASDTFGNFYAPVDMKIFGCDAYVGTAGTGGGTTLSTDYITGTSTENFLCPSLAIGTGTSTLNNAATTNGGLYTQTVSSTQIIVADIDATNTTASAVDAYINTFWFPYWNIFYP